MRKKRNIKRDIAPDNKYDNTLVAKFINHLMRDGKKSVAQKIFIVLLILLKRIIKEKMF